MKQARFLMIFLRFIAICTLLVGCGQSGKLYLPEKHPNSPAHSSSTPLNEPRQ